MENDNFDFSSQSDNFESVFATNPSFGFAASDILQSESSDDGDSSSFTGIGDLSLDFAAPTFNSFSSSSESQDYSSNSGSDGGGLLGGLL